MLTVAEETLQELAAEHGKQVATHLYGQEINAETYAIAKADLLLKGEGDAADNIVGGPEYSTLSNDAFPSREFDFMLSNPPYGKSWKSDLERMGGKDGHQGPALHHRARRRPRVLAAHPLQRRPDALPGQHAQQDEARTRRSAAASPRCTTARSLFTGDAGQGESNIRRWIIENDWLEAIVALPLNMFYNTGIATYIWVLSNRKPEHRRGKVQLIDATQWFKPLRKNLGKKNCELSEEDIQRICDTFLAFEETEQSKIFPNAAFGYWKVTVERPLRLVGTDPERAYAAKEIKALKETGERDEDAPAVIRKSTSRAPTPTHSTGSSKPRRRQASCGRVRARHRPARQRAGAAARGGRHRGLPAPRGAAYAPDAWYDPRASRSATRSASRATSTSHSRRAALRQIRADIVALEQETEGLLAEILRGPQ